MPAYSGEEIAAAVLAGLEFLPQDLDRGLFAWPGTSVCSNPWCRFLWFPIAEWTRDACPKCIGSKENYDRICEERGGTYLIPQPQNPEIHKLHQEAGLRLARQMAEEKRAKERGKGKADELEGDRDAEVERWERLTPKARKALGLKSPHAKKKVSANENFETNEIYASKQKVKEVEIAADNFALKVQQQACKLCGESFCNNKTNDLAECIPF